jgi:hypothetical protein
VAAGEGRPPPAYQEYASQMLASRSFRLMTASQRGIFYTMRLELWANEMLPAEPGTLAAILGLDASDVAAALSAVMPFFTSENGEIRCPELDAYRAHLEQRRAKLSEGGRAGAAITNNERRKPHRRKRGAAQGIQDGAATPSATPPANLSASPAASMRPLSTVEQSTAKQNTPLEKSSGVVDPWIEEYTAAQPVETTADAYRRASRGG